GRSRVRTAVRDRRRRARGRAAAGRQSRRHRQRRAPARPAGPRRARAGERRRRARHVPAGLMELWELTAREAIRETVAAYAHVADSGRFDEFAALFAPDGVLEVHGREPVAGRDAIRNYLGAVGTDLARDTTAPLLRHHVSNLRIDVVSPAEARGA